MTGVDTVLPFSGLCGRAPEQRCERLHPASASTMPLCAAGRGSERYQPFSIAKAYLSQLIDPCVSSFAAQELAPQLR